MADSISQTTRSNVLASLKTTTLDVLVIGGGIVGAGVARDAAMRDLVVGLVEQHDFASGTSSRSSRLLHGGIRYLAQGRVGLVLEASKEKTLLGKIAPHLAQPLPFIFPTRKGTPWSYWKLSLGVKVYDMLCGFKNFGRSTSLSVRETTELLPDISTTNLTGAVRYFDALTNDARLVIDTLRSASRHGAHLANYVKFINARYEGNFWRIELRHAKTGAAFETRAKGIVNAAGPWSDKLPHSHTKLRLTKGVHLVVDRDRFAVPEAVVMIEGDRIMFAIPWGKRVILGTTDTDYNGDLSNPPCGENDVAEVLGVVNQTFPMAKLTAVDVLSTWSGLRPLVADPHGNPSDISRRHNIEMSEPAWWDVTGGKLTTYRLMAEETVDQIVRQLKFSARESTTATHKLLGPGENSFSGILPPPVEHATVAIACRDEWAINLEDVMIRRTSWRYYHRDQEAIAGQVADWMATELGWSDAEKTQQIERYRRLSC